MAKLLFGIFRDLYVVLAFLLVLEQVLGGDLLHDMTRKAVITITVCVAAFKFAQPLFMGSAQGPGARGAVRSKKTECGKNDVLEWASSEMQGWRPAMEDATKVVASLPEPLGSQAFFAVFDGHGGSQVSSMAAKEFPGVLTSCVQDVLKAGCSDENCEDGCALRKIKAVSSTDSSDGRKELRELGVLPPKLCCEALHDAMLELDRIIRKGGAGHGSKANVTGPLSLMASRTETAETRNAFNLVGSTALVALVDCSPPLENGDRGGHADREGQGNASASDNDVCGDDVRRRPRRLMVANCGDSRAVVCRAGKALELSQDHKPELPQEEARIRRAGGHVAQVGPCHRVDGWGLNLSRALGDFHYKARTDLPPEQQKVCAVAEIQTLDLTIEDEFLVLGCDGCFELNNSQGVVDIVRRALLEGMSVEKAAEELVDRSCSQNLAKTRGRGGDNCSAVVVQFNPLREK